MSNQNNMPSNEFNNFVKSSFDILRKDNKTNIYDKAIKTLICYIIPYVRLGYLINKNLINLEDFNYKLKGYNKTDILYNAKKKEFIKYCNYKNILEENDALDKFKNAWEYILQENPLTKNIFTNYNEFIMKFDDNFKKIIKKVDEIDFDNLNEDLVGHIYEEALSYSGPKARGLGQFFTLAPMKKLMFNIIKPQLFKDGTCPSIYDPSTGTGGFLISYIKDLKNISKKTNIEINWDKIIYENLISGCEIDDNIFSMANTNLFISSGKFFTQLRNEDSLLKPYTDKKFDIIISNPPFGLSEDYKNLNSDILPFESNDGITLFIQYIIYLLKVNGKCAIVVPNGKQLNGTQKAQIKFRELLMKTCNLQEIYMLKGDKKKFANTGVDTVVLYFTKEKDYNDIFIEEKKKEIIFKKEHTTKTIKYYNYNCNNEEKTLITEVPIEQLASNKYIINYNHYYKESIQNINTSVEIIKIKDLFEFEYSNIQSSKIEEDENGIMFVTGAFSNTWKKIKKTKEFYNDEGLFICCNGNGDKLPISYYKGEYLFSNLMMKLIPKIDNINLKYFYYYLKSIQYKLENEYQKGASNKSLDIDLFNEMEIPLPVLETQNIIVNHLDILNNTIESIKNCINNITETNDILFKHNLKYVKNTVKIQDLFELNLGNIQSSKIEEDKNSDITFISKAEIDENKYIKSSEYINGGLFITNAFNGNGKCPIRYFDKKCIHSNLLFNMKQLNDEINIKYMYYYLITKQTYIEEKVSKGTANKSLDIDIFNEMEVPLPSIEIQKQLVDNIDNNYKLIENLKNKINEIELKSNSYLNEILNL
jgi:type I restriction enzyme M protein